MYRWTQWWNAFLVDKTAASYMNQWLFLLWIEGGKEQIFPRFVWSISYVACHVIRNRVSLSIYQFFILIKCLLRTEKADAARAMQIVKLAKNSRIAIWCIDRWYSDKPWTSTERGFPLPFEQSERVTNKIATYAHLFYCSRIRMPAGLIYSRSRISVPIWILQLWLSTWKSLIFGRWGFKKPLNKPSNKLLKYLLALF